MLKGPIVETPVWHVFFFLISGFSYKVLMYGSFTIVYRNFVWLYSVFFKNITLEFHTFLVLSCRDDYEMLLALDDHNHQHTGASTNLINRLPQSTVQVIHRLTPPLLVSETFFFCCQFYDFGTENLRMKKINVMGFNTN